MINRRKFIQSGSMAAGGLLISFCIPRKCEGSNQFVFKPNAFLQISKDNTISVILSKVEMGQGVWTALPMLIAEELGCELEKVTVRHGSSSRELAHTFIPGQATVGSSSVLSEFERYRAAGATARMMLITAASNRTGIAAEEFTTDKGYVVAGDKRFSFGELCEEAAGVKVGEVKLKDPATWQLIGKPQKSLDSISKINGTARYGIDFSAPGLLTALLLRPPVFKGKVKSFDDTEAMKVPGVQQVLKTSRGVAVIATNFWSATKGRDAIKVEWEIDAGSRVDSEKQFLDYQKLAGQPGHIIEANGNVDNAIEQSEKVLDLEYWLPYLAHAPMEPLNCSVKITGDKCEIWTGTQLQTTDQVAAAKMLGIQPENVTIETPFLGGSFGRRGSLLSDFVLEAVEIAKLSGKFIKLLWTREDDIKGGYYRSSCLHRVQIGLRNNEVTSWRHRAVAQGMFSNTPIVPPGTIDQSIVEGIQNSLYISRLPNYSVEVHEPDLNVPTLPWRSVGYSQTVFVMESVIDELAHLQKRDPIDLRKELLQKDARYIGVLNTVEEKSGWHVPPPKGISRGVAVGERNGTYCAYVVEASVQNKKIKVHRVCCAFDCGIVVNPEGVKMQIEGSIVYGLSAALYGEITLKEGVVQQQNFTDYIPLRFNEMPDVDIHLVQGIDKPLGAGEPALPPIAPALANALFAATGKRFRRLPLKHGL